MPEATGEEFTGPPVRFLVNSAFHRDGTTEERRYGAELVSHLEAVADVRERPLPAARQSSFQEWMGDQTVGRGRERSEHLLSLTNRGPVLARRHVVVIHDVFAIDHPHWFPLRVGAKRAASLRARLRSAELVVTSTDEVAERVRELTGWGVPVVTVPPAPSDDWVAAPSEPLWVGDHELRRGGFVLGVSDGDRRSNEENLVAAHRLLSEDLRARFPLVLVTPTTARASDDPFVLRVSGVDSTELARLRSAASVAVVATLDEGSGMLALDALAAGIDLVVSDVTVHRDLCRDDATYVDPESSVSIASGLTVALTFPTDADGRDYRALRIRRQFTWARSASLLVEAVADLEDPSGDDRGPDGLVSDLVRPRLA